MKDNLIFMHLPKCGGTTFHSILERMYLPKNTFDIRVIDNIRLNTQDFINLPQQEREKIKLLKGHIEFGLHKHLYGNTRYITFLRNPIERIISYYYYVKRRPNHRLYQLNLFTENMTLYDFVTEIDQGDINNGQIRFISGIQDNKERMLDKAFENIEKHFSFIGTIEKFDESLIFLQKMYGWSTPYYKVENKTVGRPELNSIDKKTIAAIEHFNTEDIALYNQMSMILETKLTKESSLSQNLLKRTRLSKIDYYKEETQRHILLMARKLIPKMP